MPVLILSKEELLAAGVCASEVAACDRTYGCGDTIGLTVLREVGVGITWSLNSTEKVGT